MGSIKKRTLALILTVAIFMSVVPFTLVASAAPVDDNTVMFSANDDADGKLYYNGYYTYGENGLGYTQGGILKNSTNTGYNTSGGHAYLFADEIDSENMWKFTFNVDENGNHVKSSGGGTFIFPFYSDTHNPNTKDGAIANEDVETLGDNYADASEYTHLAIRIKFVNDGSGNYKSGTTQPLSINLLSAEAGDGSYGTWNKNGVVYFQDINTGEKIKVNEDVMQIPLGFDGYIVFPSSAVAGNTAKTLVDLVKVHVFLHWNCDHSSTDATDSWAGTELYVGDMILTKNINSFNLVYGAPSFDVTSNDHTITVISDDANAVYSFDKDAEASAWLAKDAFNAAAQNLPKGTKYTVYAKYAAGTKVLSKEISTTANGIIGYLMDVPENDAYYTYKNKYVGWGSRLTMTSNQDPFSQSASYNSQGGIYARKSGDEYFLILNPQEAENTDGTIKESNGGIYYNSISGRGFNEDGSVLTGMPEGIETDKITHLAFRIKVQGGEKDQYSSLSLRTSSFIYMQNSYLIDNNTGLVVNPYYRDYTTPHRVGITGEFDGWLVITYKNLGSSHRKYFEETGGSLAFYFHTSGCTSSDHGKDTKSNWQNKIFMIGDIAIIENEEDFINAHTKSYQTEGVALGVNDLDYIDKPFEESVNTFEATIRLPKNYPHFIRGGVIMGSSGFQSKYVNYEVYTNGNPSVVYKAGSTAYRKTFDQVNVATGEFTHLAFVNDKEADTLTCYVNGKVAQVLEGAIPEVVSMRPGVLGGDFRDGNTMQFRGEIKNIALYSDARTADEIMADMTAVGTDNLMAHWDLTKPAVQGAYLDESGNEHNIILGKLWLKEKEPVKDYAYSFAVVGDTQIVNTSYQDRLGGIYDWIVENKKSKNIQYVMGLGDITDGNKDTEWTAADAAISKLDGVVPYSLVRGNHDSSEKFNATHDKAPYNTTFAGRYDDKLENTYRELVVNDIRYLIFTLDCCPSDDVLAWAGNIIEAHPQHNVIITTHVYLTNEGKHHTSSVSLYGSGPNNGDGIWEKLVSKYENITLVLSGHVSQSRAILNQIKGDNGNIVSEMLIDPQGVDHTLGATGMVTMLYFSEDGSRVSVETYSTVRDMYYISHGQYDFDINVIKHTHAGGTATCKDRAACDYCKEAYGEVDAKAHGSNTEVRNKKDAECGVPGYTGDTWCLDCNTEIEKGKATDALEHKGGTATCKDKAVCDTCKQPYGAVDAKAHGSNTEVKNKKDAECGVPGYTGDTWCLDCNTEIEKGKTTDALEHKGGTATCKDKAICDLCKIAYGEVDKDAHGSNTEVKNKKDAECVVPGYTGDTWCLDCNTEIEKGKATNALEHKGGEATCSAKAICDVCKTAYGEVKADNHKNTELKNKKDASCEAEGYTGDTWCKDCDTEVKKGEAIKKLDHVAADELANKKDATTTEKGYTGDKVCKDCGTVMEAGKEIPVIVEDNKDDGNKDDSTTTPGGDATTPDDDKTEGDATTGGSNTDGDNAGAGSEDDGNLAPETGDNASILLAVVMALMAGAVVVLAKKRALNK